jgi:hypothetical protein
VLLAVPLLLVSLLPIAQPAAASSPPSVLTAFRGGGIYLSPDGTHLGGGGNTARPYLGRPATVLLPYSGGIVNGFIDGLVYYSPTTDWLGTGTRIVYGGTQGVLAMAPFQGGVLTAFSGGGIYFSPDPTTALVGWSRPYLGEQVTAMVAYHGGVITAFQSGTIYFSPDGQNLHGGGNTVLVYGGTQQVMAMTVFQGGVLTAFSGGGIYFSPDGNNLGGGGNTTRPYLGDIAHALLAYQCGVFTQFGSGQIFFSPDGQNLAGGGNTSVAYGGTQWVQAWTVMGSQPSGMVTVPNLYGLQQQDALDQLRNSGLRIGNTQYWIPTGPPPYYGRVVIGQTPGAGSLVPACSSVDISVMPQSAPGH